MNFTPDLASNLGAHAAPCSVRVGFDLVQVSQIAESMSAFGSRFTGRFFTAGELEYSARGTLHERLAARFAAKEAVIKALGLSEAGIDWREIEVKQLAEAAFRTWETSTCGSGKSPTIDAQFFSETSRTALGYDTTKGAKNASAVRIASSRLSSRAT